MCLPPRWFDLPVSIDVPEEYNAELKVKRVCKRPKSSLLRIADCRLAIEIEIANRKYELGIENERNTVRP